MIALIAAGAFLITFAEAWIVTRSRQAVIVAYKNRSRLNCHRGAIWDMLFEAVLVVDILVVVAHPYVTVLPILVGAYLGTYLSLRRAPQLPPEG